MAALQSLKSSSRFSALKRPHKTLFVNALAVLAALALSSPAWAATATGSMAVSATVQATCLNAATPLAFGMYTGVQADTTATITVTCTNTTSYTVSISAGTGTTPAATVTTRKMTGGAGDFLNYALFTDAGRTLNWGETPGTNTVAGQGSGVGQPLTVYGRTAAGQFITPGAYTDTVTATITY